MLKKIVLHNFMSHADTTLDLTEGMNLFVGSSFSGKSAIMDGVYWVIANRPLGDSFVSYWAKDSSGKQKDETSVTLEFDDLSITRLKNKTENKYIINGNSLEAVGTDLPTSISQAINFSEVNFQHQMDPLFLVSATGGEVAKLLNKTVKLDLIDTFLSSIDAKKRQTKRDMESLKKEIESIDTELLEYQNLDSIVYILDKIEHIEKTCINFKEIYTYFTTTIATVLQEAKELANKKRILAEAQVFIAKIDTLYKELKILNVSRDDVVASIEESMKYEQSLKKQEIVLISNKLINKITRYQNILSTATRENEDVQKKIDSFYVISESSVRAKEEMQTLESSLPKICPTCGKEI